MIELDCRSIYDEVFPQEYKGRPLVIAGPGPGWDLFDWPAFFKETKANPVPVFALNHAIVNLWEQPEVWWVSNDHDRTFQSDHIRTAVLPRIAAYAPWRTITQKIFIPGDLGDERCLDPKGRVIPKEHWRLPAPAGSSIAYYVGGHTMMGDPDWAPNGYSVLELALEVATIWQFGPVLLVGCDMSMVSPAEYYAPNFRYKETPAKIARGGRLEAARESVYQNRGRWSPDIYILSDLWKDAPFNRERAGQCLRLLKGECAWNQH